VANRLAEDGYLNLADALRAFIGRDRVHEIASLIIDEMLVQGFPPSLQELINISWVSVVGDIEVESLKVDARN
jgi:hypothetical protein